MAVKAQCERPGCDIEVVGDNRTQAIQSLLLHDIQTHCIDNTPEETWATLSLAMGIAQLCQIATLPVRKPKTHDCLCQQCQDTLWR